MDNLITHIKGRRTLFVIEKQDLEISLAFFAPLRETHFGFDLSIQACPG
jgi:hypothetical protein